MVFVTPFLDPIVSLDLKTYVSNVLRLFFVRRDTYATNGTVPTGLFWDVGNTRH